FVFFFFFQAEDGIRDYKVTGVQTCALPISPSPCATPGARCGRRSTRRTRVPGARRGRRASPAARDGRASPGWSARVSDRSGTREIGRASCRERVEVSVDAGALKEKRDRNDA